QAFRKRFAVEKLHNQEIGAVLRADIVEMADVRMIQRGKGTGFTHETLLEFGIGREMSEENLDGNRPIKARVLRGRPRVAIEFRRGQVLCQRLEPSVGAIIARAARCTRMAIIPGAWSVSLPQPRIQRKESVRCQYSAPLRSPRARLRKSTSVIRESLCTRADPEMRSALRWCRG